MAFRARIVFGTFEKRAPGLLSELLFSYCCGAFPCLLLRKKMSGRGANKVYYGECENKKWREIKADQLMLLFWRSVSMIRKGKSSSRFYFRSVLRFYPLVCSSFYRWLLGQSILSGEKGKKK